MSDEIVTDHEEFLSQPQVLLRHGIAALLELRLLLGALVLRTAFVHVVTTTELGVLHAAGE